MKRIALLIAMLASILMQAQSPTEGVLTQEFVGESVMQNDLMQMLANFSKYMKDDFQDCQYPNSRDEVCGCFKGEATMRSNEQGVRPNADLSMICAFLVKYGKGAGVTLPSGVTWNDLESMAMKSLVFAYSTHKANKLKVCSGGDYWGSTSTNDHVWESSLWAMSVAYSAFFQWDKLSEAQRGYIYNLLKAECNYELYRSIPTGYAGDTKAEENGWEVDVLAAALGLFPDDELAPKWFERMREFAINCYSHENDAKNYTVVDPDYNSKTVAQLYKGQNLYSDYTLQNHNMFHTSYQNVVMQELGEAALALKMFQMGVKGEEKWKSNALMHNNQEVMDEVMNWLATSDGELAMPNGNDWSLFLFDQITSYSTQACFQRDANALLLENLAYKNIKARQTTTTDGSWLLRADVGARRMGVEAHRVMMTWLMHNVMPTADMQAPTWEEFQKKFSKTKYFPTQNIVRSMTKDRFTCFSWNEGLKDYSGVIVPNDISTAKIMVPFRTHNTGNILGTYSRSDNTAVIKGRYTFFDDAYAMNGKIMANGGQIPQAFAMYSTSGNAVILIDALKANTATTVSAEQGGMMGISMDEFTNLTRTIYYEGGQMTVDGTTMKTWRSEWANIDNAIGFVCKKANNQMGFGDRSNNNSIMTAKIYPSFSNSSSSVGTKMNHIRNFVYYCNVDAEATKVLCEGVQDLTLLGSWPEGWHGVVAPDPDGTQYMLLSNLFAQDNTPWTDLGISCPLGAPVFTQNTAIANGVSTATFTCKQNMHIANEFKVFVAGAQSLTAIQAEGDSRAVYLKNNLIYEQMVTVTIINASGEQVTDNVMVPESGTILVSLSDNKITATKADFPQGDTEEEGVDVTAEYLLNPSFETDDVNTLTAENNSNDGLRGYKVAAPAGWTRTGSDVASLIVNANCYTDNNFGKVTSLADGSQAYYMRMGWNNGTTVLSTQTAQLPEGKYRLSIDLRSGYANSAASSFCFNVAGEKTYFPHTFTTGNASMFETAEWETLSMDFELTESAAVPVVISIEWLSGGSCIMFDNVRLLSFAPQEEVGVTSPSGQRKATSSVIYDMAGRPVGTYTQGLSNSLKHGLYIIDGHKIIIK